MNMHRLTMNCLSICGVLLFCLPNLANGAPARDIKDIGSVSFEVPHHKYSSNNYDLTSDQKFLFAAWTTAPQRDSPNYSAGIWIFDLSNPAAPTKISQIDLGKLSPGIVRVFGERLILYTSRPTGPVVVLYDISKPAQPHKISEISGGPELLKSTPVEISPDGTQIVFKMYEKSMRIGLDFGDPSSPKPFAPPPAGIYPNLHRSFPTDSRYRHEQITDILGSIRLSFDGQGGLNFWSDGKVIRSFSPGAYVTSARILATPDVVLTFRPEIGQFKIHSTLPRPVTGRNLIRVHSEALAEFLTRPVYSRGSPPTLRALEAAGALRLMDGSLDGISGPTRVRILNDYGYMLDVSSEPERAVRILRKVVELSPGRTVAHLNLADALHNAVSKAASDDDKASLWQEASAEYSRYRELSGKDAPKASALTAFDLPKSLKSAASVCDYVAEAFNHEGGELIGTKQGSVVVNGETKSFSVTGNPTSCGYPYIKVDDDDDNDILAESKIDQSAFQVEDNVDGFNVYRIRIVPFRGKSYVVGIIHDGPSQIVDPGRGSVCTFRRSFTPKLVENSSPALCQIFSDGKLKDRVDWQPIDTGAVAPRLPEIQNFDGYADVALEGAVVKSRIGHFDGSSTQGCGCEYHGVALIDGATGLQDEPNKSLQILQSKWWFCDGADAAVVSSNGSSYIELISGRALQRANPERALLRLAKGKFEPVCRIRQVPRYTPEMK